MNKNGRPPSLDTIHYMSILIPALRMREMCAQQMSELLRIENIEFKKRYRIIQSLIYQIGKSEPLFEPIPGHYKILTEQDIEEYRDNYRRQKNNA